MRAGRRNDIALKLTSAELKQLFSLSPPHIAAIFSAANNLSTNVRGIISV